MASSRFRSMRCDPRDKLYNVVHQLCMYINTNLTSGRK